MQEEAPFYQLNREFYSAATPSTYFRDRLILLALRAAKPDSLAVAEGEGILWGQLWISSDEQSNADLPEEYGEAAHTRFVTTEAQVLFHHTVEALLRMVFAHEGRPECPWLRIAAQKDPRQFRTDVSALAKPTWSAERTNRITEVLMGAVPDDPATEWLEHRDNAIRLIRLLAARLLEQSTLYNAAKHGLTMIGGTASFHIVPIEKLPAGVEFDPAAPSADVLNAHGLVGADGANAVYLERERSPEGGYTWNHVTHWFNPEEAAVLTHAALILMDALWTVARCGYLGDPSPERMRWVSGDLFTALSKLTRGGPIQTWRRQVATETHRNAAGSSGTAEPPGNGVD